MKLRELVERAGGDLDRELYFLPAPHCSNCRSADTAAIVQRSGGDTWADVVDEDGLLIPDGSILLFPA